jgi:hypothetical protein
MGVSCGLPSLSSSHADNMAAIPSMADPKTNLRTVLLSITCLLHTHTKPYGAGRKAF